MSDFYDYEYLMEGEFEEDDEDNAKKGSSN